MMNLLETKAAAPSTQVQSLNVQTVKVPVELMQADEYADALDAAEKKFFEVVRGLKKKVKEMILIASMRK